MTPRARTAGAGGLPRASATPPPPGPPGSHDDYEEYYEEPAPAPHPHTPRRAWESQARRPEPLPEDVGPHPRGSSAPAQGHRLSARRVAVFTLPLRMVFWALRHLPRIVLIPTKIILSLAFCRAGAGNVNHHRRRESRALRPLWSPTYAGAPSTRSTAGATKSAPCTARTAAASPTFTKCRGT